LLPDTKGIYEDIEKELKIYVNLNRKLGNCVTISSIIEKLLLLKLEAIDKRKKLCIYGFIVLCKGIIYLLETLVILNKCCP